MSDINPKEFAAIYTCFHAPITELDCGKKCAPHNDYGIPFCCDTRHAVPTAYHSEWAYLKANTELWHLWEGNDTEVFAELRAETPPGQILIACLGHEHCQREYRSITCRAFPFFPYFNSKSDFLGLSYYWEYEDSCWLISNLQMVGAGYRQEFIKAYEVLFGFFPEEIRNFSSYSDYMRRAFEGDRRAITLLHRNGYVYKISPHNERMRRVKVEALTKFDVYKIEASMPFPDEIG